MLSILISLVASRAQLRSGRFAAFFAITFVVGIAVAYLAGAVDIAKQLISLVLHILF